VNDKAKPTVDSDLVLNSQVAQALTVIGDGWAFMIIRDIYANWYAANVSKCSSQLMLPTSGTCG